MGTGMLSVYVTARSRDEAERLAEAAVSEGLAACANLLGPVASIYRWRGAVERADEHALLLKTRAPLFEPLAARLRALHSDEVPCIVAWPIVAGDAPYLAWLAAETSGEPPAARGAGPADGSGAPAGA